MKIYPCRYQHLVRSHRHQGSIWKARAELKVTSATASRVLFQLITVPLMPLSCRTNQSHQLRVLKVKQIQQIIPTMLLRRYQVRKAPTTKNENSPALSAATDLRPSMTGPVMRNHAISTWKSGYVLLKVASRETLRRDKMCAHIVPNPNHRRNILRSTITATVL